MMKFQDTGKEAERARNGQNLSFAQKSRSVTYLHSWTPRAKAFRKTNEQKKSVLLTNVIRICSV